jgi:predicted alpha/beta superfamily hydrolase
MRRLWVFAAVLSLALTACGLKSKPAEPDAEIRLVEVTIHATVPEGAGDIYLAANVEELGPWRADGKLMEGDGRSRTTTLNLPDEFELEFKLTGGVWEREGTGPSGMVLANFTHTVTAGQVNEIYVEIVDFKYPAEVYIADPEGADILGTLIYWTDQESAYFDVSRHIEIWLPPGYDDEPDRRFPVIYMHDDQNLFDPRIANTGTDWGIDEAMMRNVAAGLHEPAIVVGIWSTNIRGYELSPWHGGSDYGRMIVEEIKPRIDSEFRTKSDRDNTFTMGSSMGGLISFYLVRSYPEVFSACGCVSTHVPFSPAIMERFSGEPAEGEFADQPYLLIDVHEDAPLPGNIRPYFDWGTATLDAEYPPIMDQMRPWLEGQGFNAGETFAYREFPDAPHNEAAWRERVDLQLAWMLGGIDPNTLE